MNQRDRLAEVLHLEAFECDLDYDGYCGPSSHTSQADALIARGVRIVDADTLAEATVNRCHSDIAWDCPSCRRAINELLADLEGRDLYDEEAEQRFLEPIGIDRDGMAAIQRELKR